MDALARNTATSFQVLESRFEKVKSDAVHHLPLRSNTQQAQQDGKKITQTNSSAISQLEVNTLPSTS